MRALIPRTPDRLGGPFIEAGSDCFNVLADRDKAVVIEFQLLPERVEWFGTFEWVYCQRQHDRDTVKVIRKITDDKRRSFRIPLWIQGEDVPECCGRGMYFVGQIDDNKICTEPPAGAKVWWHDVASFYVFTCSQCLECKVIGQQF
jgi:hypothetical protein